MVINIGSAAQSGKNAFVVARITASKIAQDSATRLTVPTAVAITLLLTEDASLTKRPS